MPLDATKPATAVVYVDTAGVETTDKRQPVAVTLRARIDGIVTDSFTQTIVNPPATTTGYVTEAERDSTNYGVQFALPAHLLDRAADARLDLVAHVGFPPDGALIPAHECSGAADCSGDDAFRLDEIPVTRLPRLQVFSIALLGKGQTSPFSLRPPDQVLARARQVFPGGEAMDVFGYAAWLDVGFEENLSLADHECTDYDFKSVRSCRMYYVGSRLEDWYVHGGDYRRGFDVLLGVHKFDTMDATGAVFAEPGWTPGSLGDLGQARGALLFTANDGSVASNGSPGRPLTAAAHEFGHVTGAPHAGNRQNGAGCPGSGYGNAQDQLGEDWPPDNAGRLQGIAFDRTAARDALGRVDPVVDTPSKNVFDLMSYCAPTNPEGDGVWLSARTWNRAFAALRGFRPVNVARAAPVGAIARAARSRRGYVTGIVGPTGGRIIRVSPPGGDLVLPPPPAASHVHVRTLRRSGAVLSDTPVLVRTLTESSEAGGTCVAAVPAAADVVELVRDGVLVDRVARSRPPQVRLRSPLPGARVRGRRAAGLVVRFSASDPDGDPLHVLVEYSADGGRSWRPVFDGPSRTRVRVPGRLLESARRARVRVTVNDGFDDASAVSAPFRADGTAPAAQIVSPQRGDRLRPGERSLLLGSGFDDHRHALRRSLTWYAGTRRLGRGPRLLTRLPAGAHVLRLVARDRLGRTGVARVRVHVTAVALRLTALRFARSLHRGARSVAVGVAASAPALLRAGHRRWAVGTRTRRIMLPLRRRPARGVQRVGYTLVSRTTAAVGRLRGVLAVRHT